MYAFGFKGGARPAVPAPETITMLGFWGTISVLVTMFSTMFCASDVWQRTYAARNVREVQTGFKWTYVLFGASLLATALFGMTARNAGYSGGENDVFTFVFTELLTDHAQALFLLVLMAAVTSTLNVAIFTSALSIANDYMRHDLSENVLQKRVKVIMIFVVVLCAGCALLTQDVMTLGLAVLSFSTCVAPALVVSVMTNIRLSDWTGFLSIFISIGAYLGLLLTGYMKPEYSALPFALNAAAIVLIETVVRWRQRSMPNRV